MATARITDGLPIYKASWHLKHHSWLVGSLSMGELVTLVGNCKMIMSPDSGKGGSAMRGAD